MSARVGAGLGPWNSFETLDSARAKKARTEFIANETDPALVKKAKEVLARLK